MIDPITAAKTTANASTALVASAPAFEKTWADVAAFLATLPPPPPSHSAAANATLNVTTAQPFWDDLFSGVHEDVRTEPLKARSCAAASLDKCVGVDPKGDCLCYV